MGISDTETDALRTASRTRTKSKRLMHLDFWGEFQLPIPPFYPPFAVRFRRFEQFSISFFAEAEY